MDSEVTPNSVYADNLTLIAAAAMIGADAVMDIIGDEATSTQVDGITQNRDDIEAVIIAQLGKQTGA